MKIRLKEEDKLEVMVNIKEKHEAIVVEEDKTSLLRWWFRWYNVSILYLGIVGLKKSWVLPPTNETPYHPNTNTTQNSDFTSKFEQNLSLSKLNYSAYVILFI